MINILIAENAKLISNIISYELKLRKYNCSQVFSFKEIQSELKLQKFDYIILNLYLQDAEEKDLIVKVKKITDAKIIVLTSQNNEALRSYLFQYGIIDYLNKENIDYTIKYIDNLIKHTEQNSDSNILIIEDSKVIRAQQADVLRQRNYKVLESETGLGGIEIFEKENIDLVILDLELQDIHGLKVLEEIKLRKLNVPVLMVSGTGNATSISKSLKNGASDFMRKPIIFEEFLLKTDMLIDYFRKSKELEDYKNNLEIKVKEAIKEVEALNSELKDQKRDLILANEAKDMFLANMSHELKTPLNSINVISSIMKKNKENNLTEKQVKNIEIINMCGQNLLYLIEDVLDISKLEAGEINLVYETFDIKKSLDSVVDIMLPQASKYSVDFKFEFDENIKYIYSDEYRIIQIVKNLLSNAFKFAQNGNVLLKVIDNDKLLDISVRDDGIGIDEEKLEHIFDRFKQVDGSTTRKYGGTGLGLSISNELTKLLKGTLEVKSKPNQGSIFTLCVPKNLCMVDIKEELILNKNIKKEKILILGNNLIELMPLVINLKKDYEVKQILDIDSFNIEKNGDYKFILIDETIIDKNLPLDTKSKVLFFGKPIDIEFITKYFKDNS